MSQRFSWVSFLFGAVLAPSAAWAGLIVNGDFNDDTQRVGFGFTDRLSVANLDIGWTANGNSSRSFNVNTNSSNGNFRTSGGNGPGPGDGFIRGEDGINDDQTSTAWNLWTATGPITNLRADVQVESVQDTAGTNPPNAFSALTNPTNVKWALFGFDGTQSALDSALTTGDFGTPGGRVSGDWLDSGDVTRYNGAGFETIASGTFGAVSAFGTWESQTLAALAGGTDPKYDYFILGFEADDVPGSLGVGFDNFSVEVIPEPSSILILTLGGVGLLLRRRRRSC